MERKRKRTRAYVRSYYRMALLALAAMVTARLVLLMIDMIQLQIENAGAFCIPAYAFILVFCGWELKTWTTQGKEGKDVEARLQARLPRETIWEAAGNRTDGRTCPREGDVALPVRLWELLHGDVNQTGKWTYEVLRLL